ncbi:MAG: HEAT repeat domain-containing protein [Planctomycetes bacterium]|nr:HEAT repeat domain-containing protein [Planctomycetota bacterium]
MKTLLLCGVAALSGAVVVHELHAHGGTYRGPGDVVPPGGRDGRRPTTGPPKPNTPKGPDTGQPRLPDPTRPGGPPTGNPPGPLPTPTIGPLTGPGVDGDDLGRWEFWWEFNKEPFLALKDAVHDGGVASDSFEFFLGAGQHDVGRDSLKPSESQITGVIVPELFRAIESTDQRDIVSSCMVALAKAGRNTEQVDVLAVLRKRLVSNEQEIRETAAIAMGISQMTEAASTLVDLATDSAAGRKLCRRDEVDGRTRAFATYALGLLASSSADHALKRRVFETVAPALASGEISSRDLRVASIHALSLLDPDASTDAGRALFVAALDALEGYAGKDLGPGEQLMQAHVAPAISKLWWSVEGGAGAELRARLDRARDGWLALIDGRGGVKRAQAWLVQSAVVALGRTTRPAVARDSLDARVTRALIDHAARGSDDQARYFALIALGQIGGNDARTALLEVLRTGQKALERPWAAIALGVLAFRERQRAGRDAPVDGLLRDQLVAQLGVKTPSTVGAVAIALGLAGCTDVADRLRALLEEHKNKDELAGYLCIALALAGDHAAMPMIEELVATSTRRPERLRQAAIALGKLGDKRAAEQLIGLLTQDGEPDLAKMSAIASALGYIGDSQSIPPLVKLLHDSRLTDLSRAFAAVALGGIADQHPLPWNSAFACDTNYRAAVETLTDRQYGILDIL